MEFRVLGQFEVSSGVEPRPISRTKPKIVLALMLASTNELVPRERLAHELWGPRPPRSAPANLHTYVWTIRNLLAADDSGVELVHRGIGYVLSVDDDRVDALRHRRLTDLGRAELRKGNPAGCDDYMSRADALWRGRPLADLPTTPGIEHWIDCLEEQRRSAVRDWTDARLRLGLDDELVAGLREAVAAEPLCERQHAQLIIALYRAGRIGEALSAYADARHLLAEELGLEPGPVLQAIHVAMLRRDPAFVSGDLGDWLATAGR
jgi:DNA-binding SARP family transcriptional activator